MEILEHPEIHRDSTKLLSLFKLMLNLLPNIGIEDFGLQDLIKPDPSRYRRQVPFSYRVASCLAWSISSNSVKTETSSLRDAPQTLILLFNLARTWRSGIPSLVPRLLTSSMIPSTLTLDKFVRVRSHLSRKSKRPTQLSTLKSPPSKSSRKMRMKRSRDLNTQTRNEQRCCRISSVVLKVISKRLRC